MAMGLVEAAAGIPEHKSGHLQKSAGQQVKLSILLLHILADNSVREDALIQNASLLLGFIGYFGTYKLSQFSPIKF